MKYCQNCGNQIDDNVQFCPGCGAPQQVVNSQQGQAYNQIPNQVVVNVQTPKSEKAKTGCGTILLWIFFWPIMLWVHAFRKKQAGWFILAAVVTFLIFAAYGTGSKYSTGTQTSSSYQSSNNNSALSTKTPKPTPTPISYISVTAKQLEDDLSQNAAKAKQMYEGNYYEVTGIIQTIDASGKYFSLRSESAWVSKITFDVKNDEQKQYLINNCNRDQKVTVKGKCKNVGEIIGYRFDWQ